MEQQNMSMVQVVKDYIEKRELEAKETIQERKTQIKERVISTIAENVDFNYMMQESMGPYMQLMSYYKCAMMEVETKFRVMNEAYSLQHERNPISHIKTRLKTPGSLAEKMNKLGFPISLESIEENIFDVAGVRVVCTFLEDIYILADSFLRQDDVTLVRVKDYIKNPKPGGYRSLHLIVEVPIFLADEKKNMKVEVQFRTKSMDFWASLEHQLRYKKDISDKDVEFIGKELYELAEINASLDERMQKLRKYMDGRDDSAVEKIRELEEGNKE